MSVSNAPFFKMHTINVDVVRKAYSLARIEKVDGMCSGWKEILEESPAFQKGYMAGVTYSIATWLDAVLLERCITVGLRIMEIDEDDRAEDHSKIIKNNMIRPFALAEWRGRWYAIHMQHKDEWEITLRILRQTLQEFGVVKPAAANSMIQVMVVENILGKLYTVVSDHVRANVIFEK
jgi:hypothetical protein